MTTAERTLYFGAVTLLSTLFAPNLVVGLSMIFVLSCSAFISALLIRDIARFYEAPFANFYLIFLSLLSVLIILFHHGPVSGGPILPEGNVWRLAVFAVVGIVVLSGHLAIFHLQDWDGHLAVGEINTGQSQESGSQAAEEYTDRGSQRVGVDENGEEPSTDPNVIQQEEDADETHPRLNSDTRGSS